MYRIVVHALCNFVPNFKTNHMNEDDIYMEEDETLPYTFDLPMYMMPYKISGLRTGYYSLNCLLSGWQKGEYVIVGYTNPEDANEFIGNNASAMNRDGSKIAIFAPNKDITYSIVDPKKTLILTHCGSISELLKKARCLIRKDRVKALIIDNLPSLNCTGLKLYSNDDIYACISRSLCGLCRTLNIPVISLVPITATDKIPKLRCINDIYDLAKDADVVVFLTRDESGELNPLVAKNRKGHISDIYC